MEVVFCLFGYNFCFYLLCYLCFFVIVFKILFVVDICIYLEEGCVYLYIIIGGIYRGVRRVVFRKNEESFFEV